jgi:hypothetical protein
MADDARLAEIQAGMHRWLAYVQEYHIDEWALDRRRLLGEAEGRWHGLLRAAETLDGLPTSLDHHLHTFTRAQEHDTAMRAREEVTIPEGVHLRYYAWEAEREAARAYDGLALHSTGMAVEAADSEHAAYQDQPSLMDRAREAAGYQDPPSEIAIDTSDADLGPTWQAQLAALDARLEALSREGHQHVQRQGMGY